VPIAIIFTFIVFITTTSICGFLLYFIVGWELLQSVLLAVVCTGTATLLVIYLLSKTSSFVFTCITSAKNIHAEFWLEIIEDVCISFGKVDADGKLLA
jgi:hypothetical protein